MKTKLFITMLFVLSILIVSAQDSKDTTTHVIKIAAAKDSSVKETTSMSIGATYSIAEEMPTFPGGNERFLNFLNTNAKYPEEAKKNGIQGVVYVSFVVKNDGSISDARVLKGIGGGCDEEALRVINSMPLWNPGKQNGRPVNVMFNVPVKFKIQ